MAGASCLLRFLTRNEARARLGEEPVGNGAADALAVTTGSGAVALGAPRDARELEKDFNPDQSRDWVGDLARAATIERRTISKPR